MREHLGDSNALSETLLERAIEAASRAVDTYTNRRFWQDATVATRTYRPVLSNMLEVDDISTATGLLVKSDNDTDGVYETTWTLGTDFQLEPLNADANGESWSQVSAVGSKTFPISGRRATVQVTAQFGWATIPKDVESATLLKAAALLARKDSPNGVAGFDGFGGAVRISRNDPHVMELLEPFVRLYAPDR